MAKTPILTKDGLVKYDENIKDYIDTRIDNIEPSGGGGTTYELSRTDDTITLTDSDGSSSEIIDSSAYLVRENLLIYPYNDINVEDKEYSIVDNGDGTLTVNCNITSLLAVTKILNTLTLPANTYTLSGCYKNGSSSTFNLSVLKQNSDNTYTLLGEDYGEGFTFTITEESEILVELNLGSESFTLTNGIFKPMLEIGTVVHDYQPYRLSREGLDNNKVNKSGDTMTGKLIVKDNIYTPLLANNTGDTNMPTPVAGAINVEDTTQGFRSTLPTTKTFLGSFYTASNTTWNNLINVRHRNGKGDGTNFGMYIRALMTATSANLIWDRQYGSDGWQGERTILDSGNYPNYVVPKTGGTMTGNIKFNNDKGLQDADGHWMIVKSSSVAATLGSIENKYPIYVGHTSSANETTYVRGQYLALYGSKCIHSNTSIITNSDKRVKTNESLLIDEIDKYNQFFDNLQPRKYNYIRDEEGKAKSIGFFAQEVHQALLDAGLTLEDFGGINIQESFLEGQAEGDDEAVWYQDFYSLAYDEFIPIIVSKIQYLEKMYNDRLEEIENDYNAKLSLLDEKISKLEEAKA